MIIDLMKLQKMYINLYGIHFVTGILSSLKLFIILITNHLKMKLEIVSAYLFREILILLHPFIPFITEEVWLKNKLDKNNKDYLMFANWSKIKGKTDKSHIEVNKIIDFITSIRSFKNELVYHLDHN